MGLAVVVFVTGKEVYNTIRRMKKLFTLTVIWGLLFPVIMDAQTIYHYKKVAIVDPNTGVKEQYYGEKYIHIIYDGNAVWLVDEKGKKMYGEPPKDTYDISYSNIGSNGKFKFESRENGFNVYHCVYGYRQIYKTSNSYGGVFGWKAGDSSEHITKDDYLYVSDDKRKINTRFRENVWVSKVETGVGGIPYIGGHYENRYKNIDVYEFYDTDEKSSLPSTTNTDPAHPTVIY